MMILFSLIPLSLILPTLLLTVSTQIVQEHRVLYVQRQVAEDCPMPSPQTVTRDGHAALVWCVTSELPVSSNNNNTTTAGGASLQSSAQDMEETRPMTRVLDRVAILKGDGMTLTTTIHATTVVNATASPPELSQKSAKRHKRHKKMEKTECTQMMTSTVNTTVIITATEPMTTEASSVSTSETTSMSTSKTKHAKRKQHATVKTVTSFDTQTVTKRRVETEVKTVTKSDVKTITSVTSEIKTEVRMVPKVVQELRTVVQTEYKTVTARGRGRARPDAQYTDYSQLEPEHVYQQPTSIGQSTRPATEKPLFRFHHRHHLNHSQYSATTIIATDHGQVRTLTITIPYSSKTASIASGAYQTDRPMSGSQQTSEAIVYGQHTVFLEGEPSLPMSSTSTVTSTINGNDDEGYWKRFWRRHWNHSSRPVTATTTESMTRTSVAMYYSLEPTTGLDDDDYGVRYVTTTVTPSNKRKTVSRTVATTTIEMQYYRSSCAQ